MSGKSVVSTVEMKHESSDSPEGVHQFSLQFVRICVKLSFSLVEFSFLMRGIFVDNYEHIDTSQKTISIL